MPKSNDPQRAGGTYVVRWIDDQGRTHVTRRPTLGQARKLMSRRKAEGFVAWIDPIK